MQASIWSSFFKFIEKKRFPETNSTQLKKDPIIIIGHWRTGSTLLHKLISLDPQFTAPTVFQAANPDHLLVSGKYYVPLMSKVLSKTRPMDNMKLGVLEPQEDEYALLKTSSFSPLEKLIFPKSNSYFLDEDKIPDIKHQGIMIGLTDFLKKITLKTNKQIVIKNPFHSFRIPFLKATFPNAKFIHIYRNPIDVVPSTIRMWSILSNQNKLKKATTTIKVEDVSRSYNKMLNYIKKELLKLSSSAYVEIKYEDLTADIKGSINKIYSSFGLNLSAEFNENIDKYIDAIRDYKKNKHSLSNNDIQCINSIMGEFMKEKGYK